MGALRIDQTPNPHPNPSPMGKGSGRALSRPLRENFTPDVLCADISVECDLGRGFHQVVRNLFQHQIVVFIEAEFQRLTFLAANPPNPIRSCLTHHAQTH